MGYNFPSSLAMELDFYQNFAENDPNENHIVFHSSKSATLDNSPNELVFQVSPLVSPSMELANEGGIIRVEVEYLNNHDITVFVNGELQLSHSIDLSEMLAMDVNGFSWIGVTASTGVSFLQSDIVAFSFYEYDVDPAATLVSEYPPGGIAPPDSPISLLVSLFTFEGDPVTIDPTLKNAEVTATTTCSNLIDVINNLDGTYFISFTLNFNICNLFIFVGGVQIPGGPLLFVFATSTSSSTATATPTSTPSTSPTSTGTASTSSTSTGTPSATATATPTSTPSTSSTSTSTGTSTSTASSSSTNNILSPTPTSTRSLQAATPTSTPSSSNTSTSTASSSTPSFATGTSSSTSTASSSFTSSFSASRSSSNSTSLLEMLGPVPEHQEDNNPYPPIRSTSLPILYNDYSSSDPFADPLSQIFLLPVSSQQRNSLSSTEITFVSSNGQIVLITLPFGSVPEGSSILISEITDRVPSNSLSNVVDITLRAKNQSEIQPADSVEICFEMKFQSKSEDESACLAYFAQSKRWSCEDKCLKRKDRLICGKTDHFTNFAILLGGIHSNSCSGESVNSVIAWLSFALIILAISIFVFSILVIEIRIRREANKLAKLLEIPSTINPTRE